MKEAGGAPFTIGQRVVAVKSTKSLVRGREYTVSDIIFATCCKKRHLICVGLTAAGCCHCVHCDHQFPGTDGLVFHQSSFFAPIPPPRILYVAVPETLKEQAEELVIKSTLNS